MKLAIATLTQYLEALSSAEPVPGGGSAAALCGAQGAALVAMVGALTLGKPRYVANEVECLSAMERGRELARRLEAQVDADADAYRAVLAAVRLPKATDEERTRRAQAIAEATKGAAEAPMLTLALALEALQAARTLVGRSNAACASDLGVAAASLAACAKGAWLNVRTNLPGIPDEGERARLSAEGTFLAVECETLASEIGHAVTRTLE